jgi:hypothetical protein
VRGAAAFDLLVTACLALPVTAGWFVDALVWLDGRATGSAQAPAFDPLAWFFVHLAGVLGVLWAWVRLRWPQRSFAVADVLGRVAVAGLLGLALAGGAPRLLLAFVATELAGAVAQWRVRSALPE